MSEISSIEAKKGAESESTDSPERKSKLSALSSKIGQLVLEGLSAAKNVGETVSGFFYYLTPVPQEFRITTFKTKLEPIIYKPKG